MTSREATATNAPPSVEPVGLEEAEAALVEHYPRLVRIAYLVLPPGLGRSRRVLTAHALAQRALPRGRAGGIAGGGAERGLPRLPRVPVQRGEEFTGSAGAGYAFLRLRVLRAALAAGAPRRRWGLPRLAALPPLLPQVWGLHLFPRSGGADELALDQALSELSPPARAAYVLGSLEGLTAREVRRLLEAAGVRDARTALSEASLVPVPNGSWDEILLESPEFDPCTLQARPTDLLRRRQHLRAALAATAAVVVCGTLLGLPGDGWAPSGSAAPPYARNPAAEAALDPAALTKSAPAAWRTADRTGFATWPARGDRVDDRALLRRALAVWARPSGSVRVSATPGTASGPPPGPAQLLYAGEVDRAAVVLLYDGLRVVRYAEPASAAGAAGPGDRGDAVLDFARTDGAEAASAAALVVGRAGGNVRYLTAPWVSEARVRDLLRPGAAGEPLRRSGDGVTAPVPSMAATAGMTGTTVSATAACRAWPALEVRVSPVAAGSRAPQVLADLAELTPARLTYGDPAGPPREASESGAARAAWARTACRLPQVRGMGVRAVNAWPFARQPLPGGGGTASWVCTRAETWQGRGSRVWAQFLPPAAKPASPAAVAARAENTTACGPRAPRVLAGVLWKSRTGQWYVLAAGSGQVASITASGGVRGEADGNLLAVPARPGARAALKGRVAGGGQLGALR